MRIFTILASLAIASPAAAGSQPVASFGSNPGALAMYEYAPPNLPPGRPIVVVMHGCTQTAAAMESSAGWNKLADEHGFTVVYPEQSTANNPVRCFNWAGEYGDTANLERGKGENQSILSMIDAVVARGADPNRVYVVGLSAGAAFTAVMLATWPDRFAAGSIMSGVPYRCATTVNGAYSCQNPGVTHTAAEWGDLVRGAATASARPRVQIWHGSMDTIVATKNQAELIKQWTDVHGVDQTPDATETIGKATRTEYRDGTRVVVESYTVNGMGHAIAIGGEGCPSTIGAYFSDQGICSTVLAAKFFGLLGGGAGDPDGDPDGDGNPDGDPDGGGDGGATPNDDLPGCGLDVGGGGAGVALLALAVVLAWRPVGGRQQRRASRRRASR